MQSVNQKRAGRTIIGQGEFALDGGPDAVISTLLGSCVSACIWDEEREIGGMNHVLFVDQTKGSEEAFGHGVNSMELLMNGLYRIGARRERLKSKLFGGAKMIDGLSSAGDNNTKFVREFLEREGIPIIGGDTGGTLARRLEFWPGTGRARLKHVTTNVPTMPDKAAAGSDVELF